MQKIFAANWKMHKTPQQTRDFVQEILKQSDSTLRELLLFPPASSWEAMGQSTRGRALQWGAQNIYGEVQGAFTGENSPTVLKELGGTHALIGHSERRRLFGEAGELLAKKTAFVTSQGLTPVLCVGETLEERDGDQTDDINRRQLTEALAHTPVSAPLIVAYEPVWAIGTGRVATAEQVAAAHLAIRHWLDEAGRPTTPILYGGSVKPDNAKALLGLPHVDGFLIGGASLEVASLLAIAAAKG